MTHPQRHDRLRTLLARHRLSTLIAGYIAFTAVVAGLLGLLWWGVNSSRHGFSPAVLWEAAWHCFAFLYGLQSDTIPALATGARAIDTVLAVSGLILPAILLGAVVFKIFVPSRALIIARPKLDVVRCEDRDFLQVTFYIATPLRVHNLSVRAVLRVYHAARRHDFPMRTGAMETVDGDFPLPFSGVPSRTLVPIAVLGPDQALDDAHLNSGELVLRREASGFRVLAARGEALDTGAGDLCHLFLLFNGDIPAVQAGLEEFVRYRIPADVEHRAMKPLETPFLPEPYRFETRNWEDFDGTPLPGANSDR
ncbi:MAG TPA: hypothetical protein VKA76_00345 [Gammaproteobacteria bacterium]|nr:hypothetical protein [Gammaproteobacteria bacterium]